MPSENKLLIRKARHVNGCLLVDAYVVEMLERVRIAILPDPHFYDNDFYEHEGLSAPSIIFS